MTGVVAKGMSHIHQQQAALPHIANLQNIALEEDIGWLEIAVDNLQAV